MNADGESAELRQFREEWKEEVRKRREEQLHFQEQQPGASAEPSQRRASSSETHARFHASRTSTTPDSAQAKATPTSSASQKALHTSQVRTPLSGSIARAVEIYRSAVRHEQESDLDEALRLYRQAFRLNPDVDRAYFREEQRLQQPGHCTVGLRHKKTASGKGEGVEERDSRATRSAEGKGPIHKNAILSEVLVDFPEILIFKPEDDREGVPINMIPEELLLYILRNLDTATLERFATVSRKARVLSLDPSIWRDFVYLAYKPPQIPEAVSVQAIVDGYGSNYRKTYIEHPRLRLDGVYIAVCHYVRGGLSENAWVNVSHLITYHRYLRFFPDGQVLSLLANEEYQPAVVIPMLKPSLRMKGFYVGDWRLEGSEVLITNLVEQHPHVTAHPSYHNHVPQPMRYHFQMTLALRSKPLGRWNKLDLVSYESVNIEDGEAVPLPLKHERSFWFSMVKSWQGYY